MLCVWWGSLWLGGVLVSYFVWSSSLIAYHPISSQIFACIRWSHFLPPICNLRFTDVLSITANQMQASSLPHLLAVDHLTGHEAPTLHISLAEAAGSIILQTQILLFWFLERVILYPWSSGPLVKIWTFTSSSSVITSGGIIQLRLMRMTEEDSYICWSMWCYSAPKALPRSLSKDYTALSERWSS